MSGTERLPDSRAAWPGLESTEKDRGDERPPDPAPEPGTVDETQDYSAVPPTQQATGAVGDAEATSSPSRGETVARETAEVDGNKTEGFDGDATSAPDDDATDGFELSPDVAPADTERIVPAPPGHRDRELPRITGYEILEVLGVGGMGIVYKARQARLDRYVALKMIRAGAGARPGDLLRFEAEARAVAAIDHPNIIQIHEIGEHRGLPYFSLEYLSGGSLAKRIDGKPQPVEESARIVEILARAMDVAHGHGIVHRDIKPANVLLAPDGTPKIADFGLVKRLEADSGQTRAGSILGSPSYMAPEQATSAEKVGPAADQYALGATLYEMLTGRPPFRGTSVLDTLDLVRTKEPVPPSALLPRMPRDLETICLKALQKDPARRYPDVAAMAEDLRRFRAGEPILARPISGPERLWRWCRRNPWVAGLAAMVALLLVVVAVGSTAGLIVVSKQRGELSRAYADLVTANTRTEVRRREAVEAQQRAEAEEKRAVAAGQAAIKQNRDVVMAQRKMIELLEGRLRDLPALRDVREPALDLMIEILEKAAGSMDALRAEIRWPATDELLNWRTLAAAHQKIGDAKMVLNRLAAAEKDYRQTFDIIKRLADADPGDLGGQVRLLRSHRQLGWFYQYKMGDFDEAVGHFRDSVAIGRRCREKAPDNDAIKNDLASSVGFLAKAERELGHLAPAREFFDEEREIRESFSPGYADQPLARRELSGLYEQLVELSLSLGDKDAARRYNERSAAIREHMIAEHPDDWAVVYDQARTFDNLGRLRFPYARDPAGARAFHRKALALVSRWVEADPLNVEALSRLARTLYYEATCARSSGDPAGAEAGYRKCLEIHRKLATDPRAKALRVELMLAMARCGDHAGAAAIAEELVVRPPDNAQIDFQAACGFALAAGALRDRRAIRQAAGGPLLAAADAAMIRHYTERAIACLRGGKSRGWADVATLEADPDLEPIRDDPAFRKLLAEFPRPGEAKPAGR